MYGTVCFLFEWYHHEANFERFASSLESKPNPNEWNKLTAAAGATDTKETKGSTTMAACLSRRANAGFFISLCLVCRGLAAAGQPCPAGQPMPMCVSCCACHAVIDGGCRQGKPSGLRSLPCSRQQNTISIQQRYCQFIFSPPHAVSSVPSLSLLLLWWN